VPAPQDDSWTLILGRLRAEQPPDIVDVWLAPLELDSFDTDTLALRAPSEHHAAYVRDFHLQLLVDAATIELGVPVRIRISAANGNARASTESSEGEGARVAPRHSGVDTTRTFEGFVVGPSNNFAHAAALGAAAGADTTNNPLLIYGPTGCGKTHLLSAIGNRVLERRPRTRVLYVTSESFVNEMIRAIQHRQMEEFRAKYRRSCDYLLLDDIQFLAGKERTQEEFFHTFNELIRSGGFIALTSDVQPSEIEGLEERLRSRFGSGLLADIGPTDPDTMCAIIHEKAKSHHIVVPAEVARVIADRVQTSVREAEGVVKKLSALHSFHHEPVTTSFVQKHCPDLFLSSQRIITPDMVIDAVARHHALKPSDIISDSKTANLARPRHIAMHLARELTDWSFPALGKIFRRDHSTIQYACRKVKKDLKTDADLRAKLEFIRLSIRGTP